MHEMFGSIFVQYLPCLLPDGMRRTKGERFGGVLITDTGPPQEEAAQQPSDSANNDSAAIEESRQPIQTGTSETNILIAYFTWADNTEVEDADAAIDAALSHYESVGDRGNYDGMDAATSASVLASGNTAQMAAWIQERTGRN